jgi:hypothetical protein
MLDFTGIEMAGAVAAERDAEQDSRRWLTALRELTRRERLEAKLALLAGLRPGTTKPGGLAGASR